jgi:hypothetical protein
LEKEIAGEQSSKRCQSLRWESNCSRALEKENRQSRCTNDHMDVQTGTSHAGCEGGTLSLQHGGPTTEPWLRKPSQPPRGGDTQRGQNSSCKPSKCKTMQKGLGVQLFQHTCDFGSIVSIARK